MCWSPAPAAASAALAVALLARLGYRVIASSGKPAAHELLKSAGAAEIIDRDEVHDDSNKPLLAARWCGAVDTVGGRTLSTVVRSLSRAGCVAACGLVGGADLPLSVYPFLLRGVVLAGIDSAECPMPARRGCGNTWPATGNRRFSSDWPPKPASAT